MTMNGSRQGVVIYTNVWVDLGEPQNKNCLVQALYASAKLHNGLSRIFQLVRSEFCSWKFKLILSLIEAASQNIFPKHHGQNSQECLVRGTLKPLCMNTKRFQYSAVQNLLFYGRYPRCTHSVSPPELVTITESVRYC